MYEYVIVFQIMSPPSYNDLGKNARDIFSKGYHFGLLKLDCKTKTKSGVEFSSGGSSNQDTGKVFGSLETKYRISDYGMSVIATVSVSNTEVFLWDCCWICIQFP
jgi:voltage-dependent anion channel protein 2